MSCRCSPGTCIYLPLTRADADSGIAVVRSVGGGFSRLGLAPWPSGLPAACPKKGSARVIFDNNMPLPFLSLHLYSRAWPCVSME